MILMHGNVLLQLCDTTAVNTGKFNGIVVKKQNEMETRGFTRPQYMGCQHHILDLILKHYKSTTLAFDYKL